MKIFTSVKELRAELETAEQSGIGFVPTMGALHAGHRSLVERARRENATVVVSVFVNPTQFNDKNDLRHYPRTPEADARLLERAGADFVLMPSVEEIYPEPDGRQFDFGQIDKVMEGATRPGHFNGVAQVVSRLFDIVRPARAYFGEKDFQQIAVVYGDGVEFRGETSAGFDALLDILPDFVQVDVSRHQLGERIGDADDRPPELFFAHAVGAPEASGAGHAAARRRDGASECVFHLLSFFGMSASGGGAGCQKSLSPSEKGFFIIFRIYASPFSRYPVVTTSSRLMTLLFE